MARSVGDVISKQIGTLSIELATVTARAEAAEEAMTAMRVELDALKPKPVEAPKES